MHFDEKKFGVENCINMYVHQFAWLPAESIYSPEELEKIEHVSRNSHIYLIGMLPTIVIKSFAKVGNGYWMFASVGGEEMGYELELPERSSLEMENGTVWLREASGKLIDLDKHSHLLKPPELYFDVLYIGQAFGKDGNRNALDRLKAHNKLQEISLKKGHSPNFRLAIILMEMSENRVGFMFNPHAQETDPNIDSQRISNAVDKLFQTSKAERVSLFEAALIRYFQPEYNVLFKNSFPSTNHEVLRDCYNKDFSAVIAEVGLEDAPFLLRSDKVGPQEHHIATFNLHEAKDRHVFFGMEA